MVYRIIKFLVKVYLSIFYRVKINGLENLPEGAFMLCSNHISNFDPVVYVARDFR